MSPRQLDPDAVRRRLHEIDRLLRWLAELGTPDAAELHAQWRTRLLVERILEQLVELAVGINLHVAAARDASLGDSYRDSFAAIAEVGAITEDLAADLAPSAGLRNVLVHDYLDIDYGLVAASIPEAVRQYAEYRRSVARWLLDQERGGDEGEI